jgi:hypothetical protein
MLLNIFQLLQEQLLMLVNFTLTNITVRTVVIWIVGLLVTQFTSRTWENMTW